MVATTTGSAALFAVSSIRQAGEIPATIGLACEDRPDAANVAVDDAISNL